MLVDSLPKPRGPFKVGYIDIMTDGKETESSLLRIMYPSPSYSSSSNPPKWLGNRCKTRYLKFLQTMIWNWPSWANNSEYLGLGLIHKVLSPGSFLKLFDVLWSLVGKDFTIPICMAAQLAPPIDLEGYPVVLFSHGIGCNRQTMSQLCYQLCSMGVFVAAVEHRDGSGIGSQAFYDGTMHEISHLRVPIDGMEYNTRNKQVNQRSSELQMAVSLLEKINRGVHIQNVFDDAFKTDLTFLKGSMNLTNHLYLMGHSFGGASVLLASTAIPQVKAVLALDAWMFPLAKQKFQISKHSLILTTKTFMNSCNLNTIKKASLGSNVEYLKDESGGVHLSITDIPCVFPTRFVRKFLGFMDHVDPEPVVENVNKVIWNWLSKHID